MATYVLIAVVAEETESKAEEVADHLADTVDMEAVEKWRALGVADAAGSASQRHKADVFMGVTSVIGSYERVADYFDQLSRLENPRRRHVFFRIGRGTFGSLDANVIPRVRARLDADQANLHTPLSVPPPDERH